MQNEAHSVTHRVIFEPTVFDTKVNITHAGCARLWLGRVGDQVMNALVQRHTSWNRQRLTSGQLNCEVIRKGIASFDEGKARIVIGTDALLHHQCAGRFVKIAFAIEVATLIFEIVCIHAQIIFRDIRNEQSKAELVVDSVLEGEAGGDDVCRQTTVNLCAIDIEGSASGRRRNIWNPSAEDFFRKRAGLWSNGVVRGAFRGRWENIRYFLSHGLNRNRNAGNARDADSCAKLLP